MTRKIKELFHASTQGPPAYITSKNRAQLAPFVLFDAGGFSSDEWLTINWHPHSGVATLTVPYDCNLHHQDTENSGIIKDGGFQWMATGGGIWHKEAYEPIYGSIGIMQLWVQLPPGHESGPVNYFNLQPDEIRTDGNTRVFVGKYHNSFSQATVPVDITYLDVNLKAGETWKYTPPSSQNRGFVFPRTGDLQIGDTVVEKETMALLNESDEPAQITAYSDTRFVAAFAKPSPYPIVHEYGQMHTNQSALEQAKIKIQKLGESLRLKGET